MLYLKCKKRGTLLLPGKGGVKKDMKKIFAIGVLLIFIFAFSAAAFAEQTEDGVITLTPADLVNGASGEGWFFDGNLNIESGYTLVFDGECWYPVHNHGIIKDGTFVDEVNNHGTIEDGTFNGPVFNYGTIASGNFNGLLSNDAGIIEDGSFVEKVTNYGTIKGGTFSGEVINEGVIGGGTFDNEVFNRGGGNIIGGTFTKQVTNDCTIEGGKFDCNVKNSRGGAIAGGSFGEGFSVENDGDIRGGNFDGSVSNNQNAVILTGVFTGNLVNHGKIEGGVFTGGLSNFGIVTGTADLSKLYSFDNYSDRYGKDVKLQKAVIRGDITYVGCEPVEITLNYFADDVQTAEWKVSGEFYSYEVEKWRRTDPEADFSTIEGIIHKVEAVPMDEYKITIENPIWDRFNVTVAYIPELTITGISDGDSLPIGADVPFTAIGKGMDNDAPVEGVYQYRPYYWKVLDSSGAVVASGDWVENNTIEEHESYNASVDTDAMREGQYTLMVACSEWQRQSGVWTPLGGFDVDDPATAHSAISIAFELYCNEHTGGTATCTEKAECSTCGEPYGKVDPDNHGEHKTVLKGVKKETCTSAGYTGNMHCEGCGEILERGKIIPASGHHYGEWKTIIEATETREGREVKICKICGNKVYKTIPKTTEDGIEEILPGEKSENEFNPNTGAPVFYPSVFGLAILAAIILEKRR